MANKITGWEAGNRTHFDEIVENYDNIRPGYPAQLFADIFKYTVAINDTKNKKALEIGAGTGKATVPFLNAGYCVTAVEIGANMAEFMRERFKDYKDFNVIVSAFEDTVLEENNYDLIYAASSFHWVNAEIGCPKALRLLKSGGTIALLRYNFNIVPADGEELCEEIGAVYEQYYYSYYKQNKKSIKITHELLRKPSKISSGYGFEDLSAYGFKDVVMELYDAEQIYNADEQIALLETLSDHRHLPEKNKNTLYAGVKKAIQKHGGFHKIDFTFQLYMGRKP